MAEASLKASHTVKHAIYTPFSFTHAQPQRLMVALQHLSRRTLGNQLVCSLAKKVLSVLVRVCMLTSVLLMTSCIPQVLHQPW